MKRAIFIVAIGLAFCGAAAISTQAATAPAPETTTSAPFGCDARAPNVCYFRIFYRRGDRIVILPAGMKNKVPGITIGGNYCMTLGKAPVYTCTRKLINEKYNS